MRCGTRLALALAEREEGGSEFDERHPQEEYPDEDGSQYCKVHKGGNPQNMGQFAPIARCPISFAFDFFRSYLVY